MTQSLSDSACLSVPGRVSILIVGDDPPASRALAYMLQLVGHRVHTAFDRRSGLAVAAARYPGMVILDLRMPQLADVQFIRKLRAQPGLGSTPVKITTGHYFIADELIEEFGGLSTAVYLKPLWFENVAAIARGMTAHENTTA